MYLSPIFVIAGQQLISPITVRGKNPTNMFVLVQVDLNFLLNFFSVKNLKTRCEGLSPALFFFAIFGNVTYALSICAKSMDGKYLMINAGWLAGTLANCRLLISTANRSISQFTIGSALTVFLDVFVSTNSVLINRGLTCRLLHQVLCQVFYYRSVDRVSERSL